MASQVCFYKETKMKNAIASPTLSTKYNQKKDNRCSSSTEST